MGLREDICDNNQVVFKILNSFKLIKNFLLFSLLCLALASGLISIGSYLILKSREVSGSIGAKIYFIYGPAIIQGIRDVLPNVPGKETFLQELDLVVHDVLVNDIGDTLDFTIYISGVITIVLAVIQIFSNSILLLGAVMKHKKLVPGSLITRIFYLSTFWGSIDAFRKHLKQDEEHVFLI